MIPSNLLSQDLVVGALPDRLVAVPVPLLDALRAGRQADAQARTWGEFRTAAPALSPLLWEGDAPPDDEDYSSLVDNDAFPHADALMLDWVPASLQAVLGDSAADTYGDTWLHIPIEGPDDDQGVARAIHAFEAEGYTVRRDDAAVRYAAGIDPEQASPAHPPVVIGQVPHGLVPVPRAKAERLAELHRALAQASTWGEFRARLSPANAQAVEDWMGDSWDEGGGPPPNDAAFHPGHIDGFDDSDWPEWPPRDALEWVPDSVVALGREVQTRLNGEYLEVDPVRADDLTRALQAAGYAVTRDDALVDAACGGYDTDLSAPNA